MREDMQVHSHTGQLLFFFKIQNEKRDKGGGGGGGEIRLTLIHVHRIIH